MSAEELAARLREIHHRVQEADPFAYPKGEIFMLHCACAPGHVWAWKPGDREPMWWCDTLRLLNEVGL